VPFDPARYEQEVLKPLRRVPGALPGDLLRRYAVEPTMSRDELAAHLSRIRTLWSQKAGGHSQLAQVCKRLLGADEDLRRGSADMADPAWWQAAGQEHETRVAPAYRQLVENLQRAHGSTGRISRAQLEEVVTAGSDLGRERVVRAVREAGLTVVEVDLPTSSGLDQTQYSSLRTRLGEVGVPTVVHLLHPTPAGPFTLVERFSVRGDREARLDQHTLSQRLAAAERAADSPATRARKSALGILSTGLAAGADLRVVALYHLMDRLRGNRLPDAFLVSDAVSLGLDPEDAALLVASLPRDPAPAPVRGLEEVRELLRERRLGAAEAALAALPPAEPDHGTAAALVREARAAFDRLVRAAEAAVAAGQEADAERLLDQAGALDTESPGLARLRERVPPAPPRDLTAGVEGGTVRLAWPASLSRAERVRYRVVRAEGRTPVGERDGTVVAETGDTHAEDADPPAARDLGYAVFAASGARWSRPAVASVRVVPPVAEVDVRAAVDHVVASWRAHPDTVEVRVRRAAGGPPAGPAGGAAVATTGASFTDRDVEEGVEYHYGLTAVYRDPAGREVLAPTVPVSVVPRAAATPVDDLAVRPFDAAGGSRVRLSWTARGGAEVRVRRAAEPPPWGYGDTVPARLLEGYGREVAGARRTSGGLVTLEAESPAGYQVYVPFALGGTGAVVGTPVGVAVVAPVRDLRARRTGELVVLSWVWPERVGVAEVTWTTPQRAGSAGSVLTRQVSRAQYADGNGYRLPVGPGGGTAVVRVVAAGPAGTTVSPPVSVSVPGRPVRVSYRIDRMPGLRHRFSPVRTVTVQVDQACPDLAVELVLAFGTVLPTRASQGQVLARQEGLSLDPAGEHAFRVAVPAGARKPYWLRLFVVRPAGAVVEDPPIAQMKVS
jgi:hypothetical protein